MKVESMQGQVDLGYDLPILTEAVVSERPNPSIESQSWEKQETRLHFDTILQLLESEPVSTVDKFKRSFNVLLDRIGVVKKTLYLKTKDELALEFKRYFNMPFNEFELDSDKEKNRDPWFTIRYNSLYEPYPSKECICLSYHRGRLWIEIEHLPEGEIKDRAYQHFEELEILLEKERQRIENAQGDSYIY